VLLTYRKPRLKKIFPFVDHPALAIPTRYFELLYRDLTRLSLEIPDTMVTFPFEHYHLESEHRIHQI
jgi:hypothetical protein